MGFFDFFPYTNFHNVNLDWVLQRVKEWGELVQANDVAFHNLEEANASFKLYVENYLANLDVQAQIDDKLDRMFESGELTEYLQPYVSDTVTNWLEENITEPNGVVIDSSLTVEGACADAKAVGERIRDVETIANGNADNISTQEEEIQRLINLTNPRLNGHTWSVLGDSISDNNSTIARGVKYYNHIRDRNPYLTLYLHAISGQRMTEIANRYQSIHYSDIITIFAGVNDWGRSTPTPLGTIDDTENTTFYGALDILCNGILTRFPKSLLIFITPTGNNGYAGVPSDTNRLGLTIEDYGTAIINVCRKYQIPVLDLYHISMLNPQIPEIKEEYFVDGIHYNSKGHNVASYLIENEMLRHYIPFVNALDGGRLLTVDDIESYLGIDNIYVTNGNLTYSNARDNFIIRFKSYVKRIKFTYVPFDPTYSTTFLWQCFNYDNDNNIYCTGGDVNFLFHKGTDRYTSTTRVDDFSSVIRYQNSQYILDNITERAEVYIEDGTLHITLNGEEVVSLTNARIIGFWGSSIRGFRLDNVIIYED